MTKWAHLISFKELFKVIQLEYLYIDRVIKYYRHPNKIINNKDKLFISSYWNILIAVFEIKFKILIAYYSQINNQIKQTNQIMKTYLQYYINQQINN